MERNKFLTFCWAFVPGAGQMYLNMMKKGLALMVVFWSIIAVTVMIRIEALLFILPIVWFYSFFDTFNCARYDYEQRRKMDENFAGMLAAGGWTKPVKGILKGKAPIYAAIALIALGGWFTYRSVVSPVLWYFRMPDWLHQMISNIPDLAVGAAIIIVGVLMLKKEKGQPTALFDEEDEDE